MYTMLLFMTFLVAYTPYANSCSTFVIDNNFLCEIGKIRTPIERINITALFENTQFISNQTESIQETNYNTKDGANIVIMSGLSALGGILFICSVYYLHRHRRNHRLKKFHKNNVDEYSVNPLYRV